MTEPAAARRVRPPIVGRPAGRAGRVHARARARGQACGRESVAAVGDARLRSCTSGAGPRGGGFRDADRRKRPLMPMSASSAAGGDGTCGRIRGGPVRASGMGRPRAQLQASSLTSPSGRRIRAHQVDNGDPPITLRPSRSDGAERDLRPAEAAGHRCGSPFRGRHSASFRRRSTRPRRVRSDDVPRWI